MSSSVRTSEAIARRARRTADMRDSPKMASARGGEAAGRGAGQKLGRNGPDFSSSEGSCAALFAPMSSDEMVRKRRASSSRPH